MFSRINFSYKNSPENSINSLILRNREVKKKDKQSLTTCINYTKPLLNKNDNNNQETSNVENLFSFIETLQENNAGLEMNNDNTPRPFNVGRINKKGVKIINNVYQSKYEFGKKNGTGLGDFLRGCYFILEFCETYNFQPKIVFNNCMSKFLLIKTHDLKRYDNILNGITIFRNNNFREYVVENSVIKEPLKDTRNVMADFVDYIVESSNYNGNIFMYCIAFPINEISEKNKERMRKILEPTNEMQLIINQTLDELNIYSKQYIVIHIRSGDVYLKEEKDTFTNGYIYTLINSIRKDVNVENKYLLMADTNDVKKIIQRYFPQFKTLMNPITHFGEGVVLEEEKVKNTLIDFYLMSHSKSIFSYSAYNHGSGFSYWCAKTFNIPHVCKYVK
jgi:predicted nucleic-acid-binding protein